MAEIDRPKPAVEPRRGVDPLFWILTAVFFLTFAVGGIVADVVVWVTAVFFLLLILGVFVDGIGWVVRRR